MIKRTLYFGNPAFLSLRMKQLVIKFPSSSVDDDPANSEPRTVPIEDIGVAVLDSPQLTVTQTLLSALINGGCAVIVCNQRHMPEGLFLPLSGNTIQSERFKDQIGASLPLRKQLWQQTVERKISNQEAVLRLTTGISHPNMIAWSKKVKSGDGDNLEGRAAAYYWKNFFPESSDFLRDTEAEDVNILFNYGYAILRAIIARALVISGLLPTLGIHHHNRYNAYCLADDIMEPYRPYVDYMVYKIENDRTDGEWLSKAAKTRLLSLSTEEVVIDGVRHPLMVAAGITASSLRKCFSGEIRRIAYPTL